VIIAAHPTRRLASDGEAEAHPVLLRRVTGVHLDERLEDALEHRRG